MDWDEYVAAWAGTHDGFDPRYAGPVQKGWLRGAFRLGGKFSGWGARPAYPLIGAVACAVATPALAARGGIGSLLAALLVVAGIGAQTLAQSLAVLQHTMTRLVAFYLTMVDRLSEVSWLVAFGLMGASPGLLLACGGMLWLHEYVRAKAALRAPGGATVGDRQTRIWLTLLALLLAAAATQLGREIIPGVVTIVGVAWLAFAVIGFGQLMGIVRKALA